MKEIAVIGAGIMGNGIAQVAAEAGFRVLFYDVSSESIEAGLARIEKTLRRNIVKNRMTEDEAKQVKERIITVDSLEQLREADVVIEAIIEQIEPKKQLFAELDSLCKPETIFASNTSGLSVTEMASAVKRSGQVIGMHFFNPVPVMKLVEVVRAEQTNDATYHAVVQLAKQFNKETVTVTDSPLFVVNRILTPMVNEAIFVLMEGIASAEDIDKSIRLGLDHKIGPLALADLIGLDTMLFVAETLFEETGDSKYRPAPLLRKYVRAGRLGRKTGEGFFTYPM